MMMGLDTTTELEEHVGYAARLRMMIANQADGAERAKLEIIARRIDTRIRTLSQPRLPAANAMACPGGESDACPVQ
jgi:hypothetical protein